MKIRLLILSLFITISYAVSAQSTVARLKFEDAEEAYSNNDYALTLSKLDEAEGLLKATNPKILYLRIMTQYKMVEQNPMNDYALLENTRNLTAQYLKNYETLTGNDVKYRDIYKLGDKLAKYPLTRDAFDKQKTESAKLAEKAEAENALKQNEYDEAFKNFMYWPRFELGLTADQVAAKYPDFKKVYKLSNEHGDIIAKKSGSFFGTVAGFYIKNNKTWGYYGTLFRDGSFYDDAQFSKATAESTPIINYLTKTFGFTPQKTVRRVASDNLETYKWEKNGKMFSLSVSKGSDVKTGASYSILSILCLDENFLR